MFKRLLNKIESLPITFSGWLVSFGAIVLVRAVLENLFDSTISGYFTSDFTTLVHFFLWFLGTTLTLILILHFITKKPVVIASKVVLFGSLFIWLAPVLDLIIYKRDNPLMSYIYAGPKDLLLGFVSFFSIGNNLGITYGIRLEIICILTVLFFYILVNRNIFKAFVGTVFSYLAIFLWLSFPSIFKLFHDALSLNFSMISNEAVRNFFSDSLFGNILKFNYFHPSTSFDQFRLSEMLSITELSQLFFIIIILLTIVWAYLNNRKKFILVVKNSRLERVVYYFIMLIVGMSLAKGDFRVNYNWTYFASLIILFFSYYSWWMFAVGVNDLADIKTDQISNRTRPMASGEMSESETKSFTLFFLLATLIGGFLVGEFFFLFLLFSVLSSYIYSAKPLRLKQFPVLASFLISLMGLSAIMSGYFFVNDSKTILAFPMNYLVVVIIGLTLGATIKDIKDIKGDLADGVYTIPVIFGEVWGKRIIGACLFLSFLLIPLFIKIQYLFWPSLIAGLVGYYLVNKKVFKEIYIFILYFVYIAVVLFF